MILLNCSGFFYFKTCANVLTGLVCSGLISVLNSNNHALN